MTVMFHRSRSPRPGNCRARPCRASPPPPSPAACRRRRIRPHRCAGSSPARSRGRDRSRCTASRRSIGPAFALAPCRWDRPSSSGGYMKPFFAMIILAAGSVAFAQPATMPPREAALPETVSVTGMGRVTLVPDRFTFNIGVQTSAPTVDAAVNENNERVARVVAALKAAGAKPEEIQTSGFSIFPQQDYQQGQPPRLLGYQVNNSVTVRKSEVASASKLLQVAIGAGVNTEAGLKAAFDDARAKAALLAQAAGRSLGHAMNITEGGEVAPVPRPMRAGVMAMKAESVSQVPVESGTEELSFTVSVVFELK